MRRVVVFPEPDAPTSARTSPAATSNDTRSTAGYAASVKWRVSSSTEREIKRRVARNVWSYPSNTIRHAPNAMRQLPQDVSGACRMAYGAWPLSATVPDVGVPVVHPRVQAVGEELLRKRHRLDCAARFANPGRERVAGDVSTRWHACESLRRGLHRGRSRHELVELFRRGRVLRAAHDGDTLDEQRRAGCRDARRDRVLRGRAERLDIRHVVEAQLPLALPELLIEHRRTDDVLLRVRVEPPQPVEAGFGGARALKLTHDDRAENRAHRPAGDRIADNDPPFPFGIEHVVPVTRHIGRGHGLRVVGDDLGREIGPVPALEGIAGFRWYRTSPRGSIRLEQSFSGRAAEGFCRRAEPEIRLRIGFLGAQPVEHVLRAHVRPLDVYRGVRGLELLLVVLKEILAVR